MKHKLEDLFNEEYFDGLWFYGDKFVKRIKGNNVQCEQNDLDWSENGIVRDVFPNVFEYLTMFDKFRCFRICCSWYRLCMEKGSWISLVLDDGQHRYLMDILIFHLNFSGLFQNLEKLELNKINEHLDLSSLINLTDLKVTGNIHTKQLFNLRGGCYKLQYLDVQEGVIDFDIWCENLFSNLLKLRCSFWCDFDETVAYSNTLVIFPKLKFLCLNMEYTDVTTVIYDTNNELLLAKMNLSKIWMLNCPVVERFETDGCSDLPNFHLFRNLKELNITVCPYQKINSSILNLELSKLETLIITFNAYMCYEIGRCPVYRSTAEHPHYDESNLIYIINFIKKVPGLKKLIINYFYASANKMIPLLKQLENSKRTFELEYSECE